MKARTIGRALIEGGFIEGSELEEEVLRGSIFIEKRLTDPYL